MTPLVAGWLLGKIKQEIASAESCLKISKSLSGTPAGKLMGLPDDDPEKAALLLELLRYVERDLERAARAEPTSSQD